MAIRFIPNQTEPSKQAQLCSVQTGASAGTGQTAWDGLGTLGLSLFKASPWVTRLWLEELIQMPLRLWIWCWISRKCLFYSSLSIFLLWLLSPVGYLHHFTWHLGLPPRKTEKMSVLLRSMLRSPRAVFLPTYVDWRKWQGQIDSDGGEEASTFSREERRAGPGMGKATGGHLSRQSIT